jgi:hypothetical protein
MLTSARRYLVACHRESIPGSNLPRADARSLVLFYNSVPSQATNSFDDCSLLCALLPRTHVLSRLLLIRCAEHQPLVAFTPPSNRRPVSVHL